MKKVIAIDFDGTLFENKWPEIGMPIAPNINRAKNEKANGAVLILWTCREGEKLAEALAACKAAENVLVAGGQGEIPEGKAEKAV